MKIRPYNRRTPLIAAVAVTCVLAAALVAFVLLRSDSSSTAGSARPAAVVTATIDPRLILRRQALPVVAKLGGTLELFGTLYPSLPGPNTLTLRALGDAHAAIASSRAPRVSISMPGMPMKPIVAVLTRSGDTFVGTVALPMLGSYRASVDFVVGGKHRSGTMQLLVPL